MKHIFLTMILPMLLILVFVWGSTLLAYRLALALRVTHEKIAYVLGVVAIPLATCWLPFLILSHMDMGKYTIPIGIQYIFCLILGGWCGAEGARLENQKKHSENEAHRDLENKAK